MFEIVYFSTLFVVSIFFYIVFIVKKRDFERNSMGFPDIEKTMRTGIMAWNLIFIFLLWKIFNLVPIYHHLLKPSIGNWIYLFHILFGLLGGVLFFYLYLLIFYFTQKAYEKILSGFLNRFSFKNKYRFFDIDDEFPIRQILKLFRIDRLLNKLPISTKLDNNYISNKDKEDVLSFFYRELRNTDKKIKRIHIYETFIMLYIYSPKQTTKVDLSNSHVMRYKTEYRSYGFPRKTYPVQVQDTEKHFYEQTLAEKYFKAFGVVKFDKDNYDIVEGSLSFCPSQKNNSYTKEELFQEIKDRMYKIINNPTKR